MSAYHNLASLRFRYSRIGDVLGRDLCRGGWG